MDIGKADVDDSAVNLVLDKKKDGFKKVDAVVVSEIEGDKQADKILSLPERKAPAVILDILDTRDNVSEVSLEEEENVEEDDNISAKYVFAIDAKAKSPQASGQVGKNMHIGKSNLSANEVLTPKFVFRISDDTELVSKGVVGKNMLAHRAVAQDESVAEQKYLFTANATDIPFSGSVGKSMFADVK